MKYTVGVDIGTFETKAVLVNEVGEVKAQAHKAHKMLVPQPGWAEHDQMKIGGEIFVRSQIKF